MLYGTILNDFYNIRLNFHNEFQLCSACCGWALPYTGTFYLTADRKEPDDWRLQPRRRLPSAPHHRGRNRHPSSSSSPPPPPPYRPCLAYPTCPPLSFASALFLAQLEQPPYSSAPLKLTTSSLPPSGRRHFADAVAECELLGRPR